MLTISRNLLITGFHFSHFQLLIIMIIMEMKLSLQIWENI